MKRLLLVAALSACPSTSPGTQGPEGPQGPMGAMGVPGAKGDRGDVGPQGDQGVAGPQGPQGPQGQQGPMGQVLVIDGGVVTGPRGQQGVSVLLRDAGACLIVSYEDGGSAYSICQGAAGAMGAQGAQGPQGVQGAQGLQGAQGMQGPSGSQGPQGPMGPQGPQGPVGPALLLDGGALFISSAEDGFEFAGFTAALYDGNLGGPVGAHQKCAAEFAQAHLCTDREFSWAGTGITPTSVNGFWMDESRYSSQSSPNFYPRDRTGSYSCNNWRSNNGPTWYSHYFDQQGVQSSDQYNVCQVQRQLACCRSPHGGWFRGFTTALYDGNLGGPIGANAKCSAQFPRAHLCTDREYQWAGSGVTPPSANGFWMDESRYSSQSSPNFLPRDRTGSYSCNNWRSNDGPSWYSHYFDTQGVQSSDQYNVCNVQRALACCGG